MTETSDRIRVLIEAAVVGSPELAALASPSSAAASAPGGAAVGRVVRAGDGAAHLAGKRVLVGPVDGCGECERCRRGVPFACEAPGPIGSPDGGALTGEVERRARWATVLGDGLNLDGPLAALVAREAADAYALAARAGLTAGDPVIVVGRGPVASFLAQLARHRGARAIAVSTADDGAERVRAHTAEHAAGGRPLKIFAVAEAEEPGADLALAVSLAGPGALLAVLARPGGTARTPDLAGLLAGGGAVVGVPAAHPDLLPEVAALAVKGELDLAAVGEVVTLEPGQPFLAAAHALAGRARAALAGGRVLVLARPG